MIHGDGWTPDQEGHIELAAHRAVQRRYRTLRYRLKKAGVVFCVYILAGSAVSLDPFRWFHPPVCGTEKSAAVAAEPAAVHVARDQGRWLRRLAGKPPDPAATDRFARHAADVVVVTTLAFLASARNEREPAKVTAYNTEHARQVRAEQAALTTRCTPPCPPNKPGQIGPGTMTVAGTRPQAGLTAEQAGYAARIVAVGRSMNVPARGLVVAVATARQESELRNLDHGNLDSVGLFQQRAGWGPVAERMNPEAAARKFYTALERVPGWQAMPVTAAAQAVQRSAYPNAYARWEPLAVAVVAGTGAAQPVARASCTVAPPRSSGFTTGAGVAWGGYANGRIPLTALAHPRSAPGHWFRPDAAAAFDRLSAAYAVRFGRPLGITDSYRDYAHQVATKAEKRGLAAMPGHSNHGWGLAADLIVGGYTDPRYVWMRANAPRFGWDNPAWGRPGGSGPAESWHWEFNPAGVAA